MSDKQHKEFIATSIDNIRKAHNENYLSIFAGAGISSNSNLPKWDDLISELKKLLYGDEKKDDDYLVLAEKFYNQFGENFYYQTLKTFIPDDAKTNDLHLEIVKLNIKNLITTNWDNLFEQAINEEGRFFNIIKSDVDIGSSTGFAKFIKMHGSLDKHNIVFKEQDYLEYSKNFPLIENYIKGVFSTDTVILLGYSLSDQNVKQIISWVNSCSKNIKPIYFIKPSKEFDRIEFEFYKNKNIHILYLSELYVEKLSSKGKIKKFLQEISKKDQSKPNNELVLNNEQIQRIDHILMYFDSSTLDEKIISSRNGTLQEQFLKCFLIFENRLDDENLPELYLAYKNISDNAFRYREYQIWFLCEFNKYWGFTSNEINDDNGSKWEEKLLKLPFTVRDRLRDITKLESYMDKQLILIYHSLMQIEKSYLYWKNGVSFYDNRNNLDKALEMLHNFDRLRIGNCLIIPRFEDHRIFYTKALECYWCEVSIIFLRNKQEQFKIDKRILSYTIRYFKTKELQVGILMKYFQALQKKLLFETNQEFLQQIFQNICYGFKKYGAYTTRNSIWFNNFLVLTSHCQLTQETFDKILEEFNKKIQEKIVSYIQYEHFDYFITHQSKNEVLRFQNCLETVLSFLNLFIEKKNGGYDNEARGFFLKILKLVSEIDEKYKDQILEFIDQIHQQVCIIDNNEPELSEEINDEIQMSNTFIPFIKQFYFSSNKRLRKMIKEKLMYILQNKEKYRQTQLSKKYCDLLSVLIEKLKD